MCYQRSLIHDPSSGSTALNPNFIDSINELTLNLPGSSNITTPINTDGPILTIGEITSSKVYTIILPDYSFRCSKAKGVWDGYCFSQNKQRGTHFAYYQDCKPIQEGLFPNVGQKTAIITPVFKAGNPMVKSNYIPISILPTRGVTVHKNLCSVCTSVLRSRFGSFSVQ